MSKWGPKGVSDWLSMWLPKLEPSQFAVLFAMARYADSETGGCFPSELALAEDAGLSKGYINEIVDELVAAGAIVVTEPGSRGRGKSTKYALVDDREALARHVAGVKAKRKERREKSEAARYPLRNGPTKATMRAEFPQHGFPVRDSRNGIDFNSDAWKRAREQDEHRKRVQDVRARGHVSRHARTILGEDIPYDLIVSLFKTYGNDVDDTISTINDAAKDANPRRFIAEIINSRTS